jgi:hypothetical protein
MIIVGASRSKATSQRFCRDCSPSIAIDILNKPNCGAANYPGLVYLLSGIISVKTTVSSDLFSRQHETLAGLDFQQIVPAKTTIRVIL